MKAIAVGMAAGAAALALIRAPVVHADLDPSNYYKWLRDDGFLVDGNEKYLLDLAMIVCNLKNAGYKDSDIGDYIARRENMSDWRVPDTESTRF
jgi:hypothetical protein